MKKETGEEEEVKEVPVSLSVPPDAVTSNSSLSPSVTNKTKYFEPQESPAGVVSTNCTPAVGGDHEEKPVPSLDGLSCSPSTFHPSLPTSSSTSVIVPGTFTQKNSKEKVSDCIVVNLILYCIYRM